MPHVTDVFGKHGRLLKMPFMNLVTRGCCPAKRSPNIMNEDSADLAVFNALYLKPLRKSAVRNSITDPRGGEVTPTCLSLQNDNHCLMYKSYCLCVESLHEDIMMSLDCSESP